MTAPQPFALLGHAINHIQDCMEAGNDRFSVLVTSSLAADDCFQTVLAGYLEDSVYCCQESGQEEGVTSLQFSRNSR